MQPDTTFQDLFNHLIGDMAKAIAERPNEGKQQQRDRVATAVRTIMSFMPRDAIEAMLSGHCLMFHEMVVDSVRHTLRGEIETARRATRAGIVAMNNAFHQNLTKLERYLNRRSDGRRDVNEDMAAVPPPATGIVVREPEAPLVPLDEPPVETAAAEPNTPPPAEREWRMEDVPTLEELTAMVMPLEERLATYLERAAANAAAEHATRVARGEAAPIRMPELVAADG